MASQSAEMCRARTGNSGVLLLLIVIGVGAAVVEGAGSGRSEQGLMSSALKSLDRCAEWSELSTCLKLRAVRLLDRAARSGPIQLGEYLVLEPSSQKQDEDERESRTLTEREIEASLPVDPVEKERALDEMVAERLARFTASRSLKLNLDSLAEGEVAAGGEEKSNSISPEEEGKGKKDKKGYGLMMIGGLAAMMIKMGLLALAGLALKALMVSKLALLLSTILGLKKLFSGGGGGGESHQVIYAGGHEAGGGGGHEHWGRSDHQLAYSAHARKLITPEPELSEQSVRR